MLSRKQRVPLALLLIGSLTPFSPLRPSLPLSSFSFCSPPDLIKLGQKTQALESLSSVAARRHKTWERDLETVVIRFLDLCVETGKGRRAKDVLHQYRNVSQDEQPQSLETVLRHFVKISEAATEYLLGFTCRTADC